MHRGLHSNDGGRRRDIRELLVARSHNFTPKPYTHAKKTIRVSPFGTREYIKWRKIDIE